MKRIDLRGQRFGRLVVLDAEPVYERTKLRWLCRCDCGSEKRVTAAALRRGKSTSCGCYLRSLYGTTNVSHGTTRGGARHPLYAVWVGMKDRCCNPNCGGYKNYGGRGIVVCERWRNDFAAFIADMGPRPSPKHTLDRYPDNDGNYEPGNVRWATAKEQANNRRQRRDALTMNIDGIDVPLRAAAALFGVKYATLWKRLQ